MIDFTPIARIVMRGRVEAARRWQRDIRVTQLDQLMMIVRKGRHTRWGRAHVLNSVHDYESFVRQVNIGEYEDFRADVMDMVAGKPDILWPGVTTRFAQSSGTSGGKSKYIPLTADSLRLNHYAGARDAVAHYLNLHKDSRLFSGKAFILGGSYANELELPPGVSVGDLSAHLIDNTGRIVSHFRVPSKEIALMERWEDKLPALVEASSGEDITNISGVPSWFLTVLKSVIARAGAETIHDVWPRLEVFFHGGISFSPYREEYARITAPGKMRYHENYNASEGFFATQSDIDDPSLLLLPDIGVFYEFLPLDQLGRDLPRAVPAWEVEEGKTYALIITGCNGLWRYLIGDTVRVESTRPLKITIAGRTKSFINVFGEEVMEHNAINALEKTCSLLGCSAVDFTAGPVYTTKDHKGHHHWYVEWGKPPHDIDEFRRTLDKNLQEENSDYQAKRHADIFLDCLTVETAPAGLFDRWLALTGKLGGQRKIPRLCNDRHILDQLDELKNN